MKPYLQALSAFVLGFIAIATIAAVQSTARFPSIEIRDFLTIVGGPSTTNHIGGNATVITNWLALSGTTNRLSDDGTNLLRNGVPIAGGTETTNIHFNLEPTDVFWVNTNWFAITNGNVGIGTNAPGVKLHVKGTNAFIHLNTQAQLDERGLSIGSWTTGDMTMGAWNSLSSPTASMPMIFTASNVLWRSFSSGAYSNRMFLNSSGHLGIGTNAPGATLHVIGTGASIALNPNAGASSHTLLMNQWTTNDIAIGAWNSLSSPSATIPLIFSASNVLWRSFASGAYNNRMLLSSAGDLGVGTTNPAAKLDVNGTLRVQGNITSINGVATTWPSSQGAANSFLKNNGSGLLTWSTISTGGSGGLLAGDGILFTDGTNISANFLGGTNVTLTTNSGVITINSTPATETTNIHFNLEPTDVFWVNTNWFAITNGHVGIGRVGPIGGLGGEQMTIEGSAETGFQVGSTGTGTPRIYFRAIPGATPRGEMGTRSNHRLDLTINTTPRMTIAVGGNVGVGDTTPASLFTVGNGDLFQVDSIGNIIRINDVATSFPAAQGSAGTFLMNNGSGTLTWEDPALATSNPTVATLVVTNYSRNVRATLAYSGSTNVLVDFNVSNSGVLTLTNTAHLIITNLPALPLEQTYILHLVQDGTGGRAVTFNTSTIKWPGGISPTVTTNANAWDVATFVTGPSGTNVAAVIQQNF